MPVAAKPMNNSSNANVLAVLVGRFIASILFDELTFENKNAFTGQLPFSELLVQNG